MEEGIKKTWGENCFFSNGTSSARGVITIIPNNFDFSLESTVCDNDGRYIILTGQVDGKKVTLVNFYAPTQDKPDLQVKVFEEICEKVEDKWHETILCGDLNSYLNSMQDKFKCTKVKQTPMVNKIIAIMEEHELCDIWRVLNPETMRYTWRSHSTKGIAQSRLDYFIMPSSFIYNVIECSINTAYMSDHNIISLRIMNLDKPQRGKGMWKFNASLLRDKEYTSKISGMLEENKERYAEIKDKRLRWDVVKLDVRGLTISHCSYKVKTEKKYEKHLIQENITLEEMMCTYPDENIALMLATNKRELDQINHNRTIGAQIRANCIHIENDERNSKYFFSREKSRAEAKAMTTMISDNGNTITDLKEIANEQKTFYQTLYKEPESKENEKIIEANNVFLENAEIIQIESNEKKCLDEDISKEEIAAALKELANNKAPGSDGLDASFYKFFWSKIGVYVCGSLMQGINEGEMSIEQKRAVLTLLPKKDKDPRYIKNWRPLSLLNVDYKILAKLLARRLQKVLSDIINTDQTGCIAKRSAHSNIRSIIDIVNHANEKKLMGIIAFIDFEKAFDTVKWSFLYKTLEKMNFGNYFINCIKTLYNDITTYVSNCGSLSAPFKPTRGIRQGCPISANLFVIIVETLANVIRQNKDIKGYRIGNNIF
jgi:exonuclease III